MDETLRVKIIADTTQAQSSMKSLNKETKGLSSGTSAASQAVNQLDKTLNSIGFKSIKIKGIADAFKSGKSSIKAAQESIRAYSARLKEVKELHKTKFFNPFTISLTYLDQMSKKSEESVSKIKNLQKALSDVSRAGAKGDFSGLAGIRQQVEELARSRNQVITKTFNESDFSQMKDSLLKASKEAAKGSTEAFSEAMSEMATTVGKATEKLTFKGVFTSIGIEAKALGTKIIGVVKKVASAIAKAGIVGLILGAIAAIKNAFNVSALGDSIDKTSQKVGMSTTAFQKWSYILERCGLEASQLQTAMRNLTRNSMNNADRFTALGINPEGLSQQQLFEQTVKALQNISDSTERARQAYKLFGQSSAELAPLLGISNAEVQRLTYQYDLLGATMSGKVVRASADMQDALTDLKAAFQGLKNTLAQAIIPIITKIIIRLTVLVAKINMVLQTIFGIELEYQAVEESTAQVTSNVSETNKEVKKLKTLISGFDELNIFPSKDNGAELSGLLDELGDYGSDVSPYIGNILPDDAIKELEDFRDHLDEIKQKWEEIKEVFADIEYTLSGQKWKDAFETGNVGSLSGWDMLLDFIGQVSQGLWDILNLDGEGGLDKLFEDWFPVGGDLPEEGWFDEWVHRVFYGTENEIGLFEMPGIKEIKEFVDWINENLLGGNGLFGLGKMESFKDMFTLEGAFGTFDWESSGLYKFGEWIGNWKVWEDIGNWDIWKADWWAEKWKNFKHNIDPSYWWNGDESHIGLKEMLGFDKIAEWDIWKGEFWSGLWGSLTGAFNSGASTASNGGLLTASIKPMGLFHLDGIGDWDIWKSSWWEEKWAAVKKPFEDTWNSISQWFQTNIAPKFTSQYWKQKFESIKQGLAQVPLIQNIMLKWAAIKLWWSTSVAPKFTLKYWRDKFSNIKIGLEGAPILIGIEEKWNAVKRFWSESIAPKFTWAYWKEKWNTMVESLASIDLGNAAKKIMNGFLQAIEDGINKAIDAVNSSGVAKFIGINLGHVWIPKFQTYAKGGVIDQPTLGLMGEYPGANSNPEIVTPENKLTEIFDNSNNDLIDVFLQCTKQIIEAISENKTEVVIGDTQVARAAARGNKQYRLQTGQSLF